MVTNMLLGCMCVTHTHNITHGKSSNASLHPMRCNQKTIISEYFHRHICVCLFMLLLILFVFFICLGDLQPSIYLFFPSLTFYFVLLIWFERLHTHAHVHMHAVVSWSPCPT